MGNTLVNRDRITQNNEKPTQDRNTIKIYQGFEYRTYLCDIYKAQDELYYPQYMQAAKCIDEITTRKEEYLIENKKRQSIQKNFLDEEECYTNAHTKQRYPNNIMAFCARRGQGKTSAMMSMIRALIQKEDYQSQSKVSEFWNEAHKKNGGKPENSPVITTRYHALETIDPTTMEEKDSILEIIIARMLRTVQKKYGNSRKNHKDMEEYRKFIEKTQDVVKKIRTLKTSVDVDRFGDIEKISERDDSRSTRYAFMDLVQNFLKYIEKDMLIVPVDDADLDPNRVFEVSEDLRKYCMVPGIIVMMAVHLETLRICIEQQFVKNYRFLLDQTFQTDHLKKYKCHEMAERFVDKFIPDMHQIHLPNFAYKIQDGNSVKLEYKTGDKETDIDILAEYDGGTEECKSYQDRLARLIYEKTGIVLISKPGHFHPFMPKRYRELTHMLSFFTRMTSIEIHGDYTLEKLLDYKRTNKIKESDKNEGKVEDFLSRRVRNLEQMENYFLEQWCPINLSKNQCEKLSRLRTAPIEKKNHTVIEILKKYCLVEHKDEFVQKGCEEIFYQLREEVTYADVLLALHEVKNRLNTSHTADFVFAISMYYTIYMNKLVSICLKQKDSFEDLLMLTGKQITRRFQFSVWENLTKTVGRKIKAAESARKEADELKKEAITMEKAAQQARDYVKLLQEYREAEIGIEEEQQTSDNVILSQKGEKASTGIKEGLEQKSAQNSKERYEKELEQAKEDAAKLSKKAAELWKEAAEKRRDAMDKTKEEEKSKEYNGSRTEKATDLQKCDVFGYSIGKNGMTRETYFRWEPFTPLLDIIEKYKSNKAEIDIQNLGIALIYVSNHDLHYWTRNKILYQIKQEDDNLDRLNNLIDTIKKKICVEISGTAAEITLIDIINGDQRKIHRLPLKVSQKVAYSLPKGKYENYAQVKEILEEREMERMNILKQAESRKSI